MNNRILRGKFTVLIYSSTKKRVLRILASVALIALIADWFTPPEMHLYSKAAIAGIRVYQETYGRVLSTFHLARCKFAPSCSRYGILAYRKHGTFRGTYLTARRLVRCSPLSSAQGEDWP